jgi:O-antigen/teichoic acid export membrane protein
MPLRDTEPLTADEKSFRNAKHHAVVLIAYKALADLAGKGALFIITIAAARRLSPEAFGVFSLGSTLGWIVAVTTDFGIQFHVARAVARHPEHAAALLAAWLRVRLWTVAGGMALVLAGLLMTGWTAAFSLPIAVLALVYACSGLVELLHYFYRGLSRSDLESSLILWQRSAMLVCGLAALAWRRDVTVLAVAMLLPVVATLAASMRIASRLAPDRALAHTLRPLSMRRRMFPAIVFNEPSTAAQRDAASARDETSWRVVWPIGVGIVLSALYFRVDVFLVQRWSGTEAVALYNAVFRLIEALRLFPAAVLAVTLPSLCRTRDVRPLARVAVPLTASALGASAVLWMASGWLIPFLYGGHYAAAVPAFRILLLSLPLLSLNYALTHQLVGWNGQRAYAGICALALVANVALNARLIPAWSIDGAAWATLGTELCVTAGCAAALWNLARSNAQVNGPMPRQAVAG